MDLKLNVSKKGLSTTEEVINEEYTLHYGHIFRGKSAYEYAVEGGFVGSEEEFEAYVGNIGNLSEEAKEAAIDAQDAREQALVATDIAISASRSANQAAQDATTATENAIQATANTNEAIARAEQATADAEAATEKANEAAYNANNAAQRANEEVENLREKADINGYYPEMSVGMADNLVGRGDVQDAHINFRPSAGADNITDGAARIKAIKGNSVVYNQWLLNSRFASTSNWAAYNAITTIESDGEKLTATIAVNGSIAIFQYSSKAKIKPNHTYLVEADFELFGNGITWGVNIGVTAVAQFNGYLGRGKRHLFITAPATPQPLAFYPSLNNGKSGDYAHIYSVKFIDLTQMFGAEVANNITSYEDYLQLKPMNIEDEFEYNEGELIDMKVDALVSVGDNAWDEEWENGTFNTTTGANIDALKTQIRSKNLIKVLPNTNYTCTIPTKVGDDSIWCMLLDKNKEVITGYTVPYAAISGNSFGLKRYAPSFTTPANAAYLKFYCSAIYGNVYTNDICFHLEQSGYKNGKYYPYQQNVKDLSFISEAFPNGMRSAGSVFDEIRFNPTKEIWEKVERVGVRAYAEGDAEDSSVITDGETTNYPLDNPTPTTIDLSPNLNLDYLVWDFGTEEAMASVPSAPFRADINYEPNAVDDLRWAVAEIRSLRAQIAQLQSTQVSETNLME